MTRAAAEKASLTSHGPPCARRDKQRAANTVYSTHAHTHTAAFSPFSVDNPKTFDFLRMESFARPHVCLRRHFLALFFFSSYYDSSFFLQHRHRLTPLNPPQRKRERKKSNSCNRETRIHHNPTRRKRTSNFEPPERNDRKIHPMFFSCVCWSVRLLARAYLAGCAAVTAGVESGVMWSLMTDWLTAGWLTDAPTPSVRTRIRLLSIRKALIKLPAPSADWEAASRSPVIDKR